MAFLNSALNESFLLLPVLVAFLILGVLIIVVAMLRRHRAQQEARIDVFYPPFVGDVIPPKEETYVVPRDWKPSSSRVYAPLSIPLEPLERPMQSRSSLVRSLIAVLPPRTEGPAVV